MKTRHIEGVCPDETYITVSSVFNRVGSCENGDKASETPSANAALDSLRASMHSTSKSGDEESCHDLDLIRRSNALSVADELATLSFMSLGANQPMKKGVSMSFGSLPLPGVDLSVCSRGVVSAAIPCEFARNGNNKCITGTDPIEMPPNWMRVGLEEREKELTKHVHGVYVRYEGLPSPCPYACGWSVRRSVWTEWSGKEHPHQGADDRVSRGLRLQRESYDACSSRPGSGRRSALCASFSIG